MIRHCRRSFQFAMALAPRAGLRPDPEALFCACLLHDLGLEPAHDAPGDFEEAGAEAAAALMERHGASAQAPLVAASIRLHTSLHAAEDERPEVALLHMGAVMDVTGARLDQLPPGLLRRILAEFPREGTKRLLLDLLGAQIRRKPDSRIGHLERRANLLHRIAAAPFEA